MTTIKTLYAILGVEPTASSEDVDEAFLRIKSRYPQSKLAADENARLQFQAIQQAYTVLGNPDSRSLYDVKLARTGIRVASPPSLDETGSSWLSTRNIAIAGLIVLAGSGMWLYHARQQANAGKEIVERALRIVEEEKRRRGEIEAQEEQRRQSLFEEGQRRRNEADARSIRSEGLNTGRQVSSDLRRAQMETEAEQRRAQYQLQQRERVLENERRQAELEARRQLQEDKRQLRELCMRRYGRSDC